MGKTTCHLVQDFFHQQYCKILFGDGTLATNIYHVVVTVPHLHLEGRVCLKNLEGQDLRDILWVIYVGVSKNSGTPKSSILVGFSIINHPFSRTPIFGNTYI